MDFIDLFAGIGGMRLAFEGAGCKCVFSSEWDKYARKTYSDNFGDEPAGDLRQIEASQVPDHDILLAGIPCQPFSSAGIAVKRYYGQESGFFDKTQGTLFFDVLRLLKAKRPKAFLIENVKNLVSHDKGNTFKIMHGSLREIGYQVHYKILDAKSLVPQHRERIFIVGFDRPRGFDFPAFKDRKPKLMDILDEPAGDKYTLSDGLWAYLQRHAEKHKAKGNGFGYGLADRRGITRTLSARYYKDGSEILIPQAGRNPRKLTPRECCRLMGFPESYRLPADCKAYKQLGNSVVVPVVRAIAERMVSALLAKDADWPFQQA